MVVCEFGVSETSRQRSADARCRRSWCKLSVPQTVLISQNQAGLDAGLAKNAGKGQKRGAIL